MDIRIDFSWVQELQEVDINDPSSWSYSVRVVVAVVVSILIVIAGYYFVIVDQRVELDRVSAAELTLKEDFLVKKALAINLEAYKVQMAEAEQTFEVLFQQLPNRTEVPDLLIDITQAGLARGLKFDRFKPEEVVDRGFYAEMPVSIVVTGSYHQIGEFVSDIAALPRIVSVDTFKLTRSDAGSGELRMEAVTKTYHYLEE